MTQRSGACNGTCGSGVVHAKKKGLSLLSSTNFFYGYNCQRQAHTYYPPFLYRNERREYLTDNKLLIPGTKLDEDADPLDEKSFLLGVPSEPG